MESQNFKSTKLVTAFFSFLEGFPYYGQNTTRVERYLHSLASIARTGEEIVCYLEEEHLEFYKDFWNSYGATGKSIMLIILVLMSGFVVVGAGIAIHAISLY